MQDKAALDILWMLVCAGLVFMMQGGFLCLESGLTRTKNTINVAIKNLTDFGVSVLCYWLCGFAFMFGMSGGGWIGQSGFALNLSAAEVWPTTFFIFHVMFCATAATIVSGAAAERLRFWAYIVITILISVLIYPVFGHWAWGGALNGTPGWLERFGFVDFAGATVVHSVGGWVALATVLVIGPRTGRFSDGEAHEIPASNLSMTMLGVVLLIFGWFGFNGGSTYAMSNIVPVVIANTILAAASGLIAALAVSWWWRRLPDVKSAMNGVLAGLVAISACSNAVPSWAAVVIGAVGGLCMLGTQRLLLRFRIDDAVLSVPVHLAPGIWGTLALAVFAMPGTFADDMTLAGRLIAQIVGVLACGIWAFGLAYFLLMLLHRWLNMRVSAEDEHVGLNVSEHNVGSELHDLLDEMAAQVHSRDLSRRVPIEPFTVVGQIAGQYNRLLESLERSMERTQGIIRNVRDGIMTFTQDGMLTSLNPGAEQIFGLRAADVIGSPAVLLFSTGHSASSAAGPTFPQLVKSFRREFTVRTPENQRHVQVTVTQSDDEEEPGYTAMVRDVTAEKDAQEAIRASRESFFNVVERIQDGLVLLDVDGKIVYCNQAVERFLNQSPDMLLNQPFPHPYRRGKNIEIELHHNAKVQICELVTVDTQWLGCEAFLISMRDITERRRSEQALRSSEQQFRAFSESAHDAIISTNPNGEIVYWNQGAQRIFGYTEVEAIGRSITMLVPWKYQDDRSPVFMRHSANAETTIMGKNVEFEGIRSDGSKFPMALSWSMWEADGRAYFSSIIRDVTEQQQAHEALEESKKQLEAALAKLKESQQAMLNNERLRVMGEMASGIAHDLNNVLMPIVGFSDLLRSELDQLDEQAVPYLDAIQTAATDAVEIVRRLSDLYRLNKNTAEFESIDVNDLVRQVIALTQPKWRDQAMANGVEITVTENLNATAAIAGIASQLREAMTNLVFNAVDAIKKDGSLEFGTANDSRMVHITIRDTGEGMSQDILRQCMEPFYSTKGASGTGMGLAMVSAIAHRHQGQFRVESAEGSGTCVYLTFPAVEHSTIMAPSPVVESKGGARILIVDDEPLVRRVVERYLERDGHHVVAAQNAKEALSQFTPGEFDLMITDQAMPGITGTELVKRIREQDQTMPIVLLTGFGVLMEDQRPSGVSCVVNKPVSLESLRATLREVGV